MLCRSRSIAFVDVLLLRPTKFNADDSILGAISLYRWLLFPRPFRYREETEVASVVERELFLLLSPTGDHVMHSMQTGAGGMRKPGMIPTCDFGLYSWLPNSKAKCNSIWWSGETRRSATMVNNQRQNPNPDQSAEDVPPLQW